MFATRPLHETPLIEFTASQDLPAATGVSSTFSDGRGGCALAPLLWPHHCHYSASECCTLASEITDYELHNSAATSTVHTR